MNQNKNVSNWWIVLPIPLPVLGLVLYLMLRKTEKEIANKLIKGVITGFVLWVILIWAIIIISIIAMIGRV